MSFILIKKKFQKRSSWNKKKYSTYNKICDCLIKLRFYQLSKRQTLNLSYISWKPQLFWCPECWGGDILVRSWLNLTSFKNKNKIARTHIHSRIPSFFAFVPSTISNRSISHPHSQPKWTEWQRIFSPFPIRMLAKLKATYTNGKILFL